MPTMIGEYSEGHLLKTAKNAVQKKTLNSAILDPEAEERIPKFDEKGENYLCRYFGWKRKQVVGNIKLINVILFSVKYRIKLGQGAGKRWILCRQRNYQNYIE